MKKSILRVNCILYAVMFFVVICCFGIDIGRRAQILSEIYKTAQWSHLRFDSLYIVAISGVLWLIAYHMYAEHTTVSGKSCLGYGIFTLASVSLYWIASFINRFDDIQKAFHNPREWFTVVFFAEVTILLLVSLAIFINYLICAIEIRKENKKVGWKE